MASSRVLDLTLGASGHHVTLRGAWTPQLLDELQGTNVLELELNFAKGWRGIDVSFLEHFPQLRALEILDYFSLRRASAISSLVELRELKLYAYYEDEVRLENLCRLSALEIDWMPKLRGLASLRQLSDLFIVRYQKDSVDELKPLCDLKRVGIVGSRIHNLIGLTVDSLEEIDLRDNRRLTSLHGLERAEGLTSLRVISARKLSDINAIANLRGLKSLYLEDCGSIPSLKFVENMPDLEMCAFPGTTYVEDGDLDVLFRHPSLRVVAFQNRHHYTRSRTDFERAGLV